MLQHLILGRSALVRATAGPRNDRPDFVARYRWALPGAAPSPEAPKTPKLTLIR